MLEIFPATAPAAMTEEKFLEVAYNTDVFHAVHVAKHFSVPANVIRAWVAAVMAATK